MTASVDTPAATTVTNSKGVVLPAAWGDPEVVPQLVAQNIVDAANAAAAKAGQPPVNITKEYLTEQVSEITPETQITGSALLQITLIDSDWVIQRSGICDTDEDGLLYNIDINFPMGTDVWWRLAMVEGHSDLDQPNLIMTFQMRVISYLMDCWGPLGWPSGKVGSTRAQFIKMLVDRMPSELPKASVGPGDPPNVKFICPELNVIQPIAGQQDSGGGASGATTTNVQTPQQAQQTSAATNKQPSLTAGSKNLTAKGSPLNSTQLHVANLILAQGMQAGAGTPALEASMVAGILESDLGLDMNWNPTYGGALAGNVATYGKYGDANSDAVTNAEAHDFFTGQGQGYQKGGAIAASKENPDPRWIASQVEAPTPFDAQGYSQQYEAEAGWDNVANEAQAIVQAFGGGSLSGSSSGGATSTVSDVSSLARGTSDNPDEDTWTCAQRLASEVDWYIFADPSPAPGVWGNYLYYIDGPTLAAQKPALYLDLSDDGTTWSATDPTTGKVIAEDGVISQLTYTFDNTAFQYQKDHKVKGKQQHHTRVRTPQTPSQVKFNMVCGVMEFNAGIVFIFRNAGPLAQPSRWIVEDVTHNGLQDIFAQFTLGPPVQPLPEPAGGASGASGAAGGGPTGGVGGYTNPLAKVQNLTPERIDMGVDYSGSGPLVAIGNAKVVWSTDSGAWPGGGEVVLHLTDGVFKDKTVYYCEELTTNVQVGQTVKPGDQVATLHGGMEIGWASGDTDGALAAQLHQDGVSTGQSGDVGGVSSAAGQDFNAFLVALGAPAGILGTKSTGPGMPADWPKLSGAPSPSNLQVGSALQQSAELTIPVPGKATTPTGIFEGIF